MKKIIALVLVIVLAVCSLASCSATPNSDPEAAKLALENAGWKVNSLKYVLDKNAYVGFIDAFESVGNKGVNNVEMTFVYFESEEAATNAWNSPDVQNYIKVSKDCSYIPDSFVSKQVGNIIYYGYKDMAKDAQ